MKGRDYQARLQAEKRNFNDCVKVEDVPDIFHYWSNRHIRPRLETFGFSSPNGMIRKYVEEQCEFGDGDGLRFVSIGSGNCELEAELASHLQARGHINFVIDCLDLNLAMLDRARVAAVQSGVENHLNMVQCDFNEWEPSDEYDAVIANQALHHVLNLERLFAQIKRSLKPHGHLIVSDMIGRNGHQLWPEALRIVHEFWHRLPPSYRFNHQLGRYEELFVNTDYSRESFEAIRSQDILPLLLDRFHFKLFVGFANIINPFVERSFGPNFDATARWDRDFIDEVHARDEQEIRCGRIKPTHMLAVMGNDDGIPTVVSHSVKPEFYVRWPDAGNAGKTACTEPSDVYHWGAWPHSSQSELEIACRRLTVATSRIREVENQLEEQQSELEKRTDWARRCEKQNDERTTWALQLDKENRELTAEVSRLDSEFTERTLWALRLEKELEERTAWALAHVEERTLWALRLDKEVEQLTELAQRLSRELEERTVWALQLDEELKQVAWAQRLNRYYRITLQAAASIQAHIHRVLRPRRRE
jgi:SAM-dependent methyltransferase